MRILVTGALGKVGAAAVDRFASAGHAVTACDLARPLYEGGGDDAVRYVQADVADAGDAFAVVRGHDAVVHAAAIPEPQQNVAHRVFSNNLMGTFNVAEAAVRSGCSRLVHVSSETVPGFVFAERPFLPAYAPIDEDHPVRPQDPYALAKAFGEQLMDAAVARSDLRCTSIRPTWVQWEGNYERSVGPFVRDPSLPSASLWAYIDVYDLADALLAAVERDLPGHEVFGIASPENVTGRPLEDLLREHHGDAIPLRGPLPRPDASGMTSAKAARLLGYAPSRSWRDYLDDDGRLRAEVRERLDAGDTGVQRGRERCQGA
jgi:nucleoside-diphosphate-sugar epimerase